MSGKIYKGDFGVVIRVDAGIDLTSVSTPKFKIKKPNGVEANWTATVENPATAGFLTYTTISGDFDVSGNYYLQVEVYFSGKKFSGETAIFRIYNKFE